MLLNKLLTINTTKGIAVTVQSLSSAANVSEVFVQKSAVRAKSLLTQPCYCILFDSLPAVLKDLSVRYKNAFATALWNEMTSSQPVQQSDTEARSDTNPVLENECEALDAIEQEMSVEEATRQVDVSSDTNTLQAGDVPCIMSSALLDYSGADFNSLPFDVRDTIVHAMKEADYNSLTWQYSILCDSGCSDMDNLWTAFVLKLHREDGYYPKLPIRVRGCIYSWQGQLAEVFGVR